MMDNLALAGSGLTRLDVAKVLPWVFGLPERM